ncbi:MAG: hypothetical protein IJ364_03285 [Oscillospiraceae bacterium]|nr:hypothetical protein [Oscillospiraceae bacterium]
MKTIIRSEVTIINKQKFLAELGRLLTFMYEEDRQLALSMYEKMFDSCGDIHALMQILVSPTRQAVVLARAYDATERKLQVYSSSREEEGIEDDGELPDFVLAIDGIYQSAIDRGLLDEEDTAPAVLENQISLFEDIDMPELLEEEPVPVEEEVPEEVPVEEISVEEVSEETSPEDEVDAFLASFAIAEEELVPVENVHCEESEAEEEVPEEPAQAEVIEELVSQEVLAEVEASEAEEPEIIAETVRKPRVFLLILYVIAAIPLTLAGLALLLIPTALVLALASAVILTGSASFVAAFSGFAVFADMLVVLGTALIILAVGLILLWLFVWFIGGAMVGLVKSIINLGSRCCFKEVAAV